MLIVTREASCITDTSVTRVVINGNTFDEVLFVCAVCLVALLNELLILGKLRVLGIIFSFRHYFIYNDTLKNRSELK